MGGGQILQIAESSIGADRCELQLEGELDVGLQKCDFVDSTGIALFLQVRCQLEGEGGRGTGGGQVRRAVGVKLAP